MELDPTAIRWVQTEAAKLVREGITAGSPRETKLLRHWKAYRPKMYQAWERAGLVAKLAFVLDMKRYQAMMQYIRAGMPPTDAEEEAAKDWLLMEPEQARSTNPNLPLSVTTFT
jgi:hypothetical protein